MAEPSVEALRSFSVDLAQEAGELVMRHYRRGGFSVSRKSAVDLVTTADQQSEALVLGTIRKRFPTHALLAEESGTSKASGPYRWICDPLDGTTNFAHRIPHFCVLLAVQKRVGSNRWKTLVGVTVDPTRDERFVAVAGRGATLNGRPIRVSNVSRLLGTVGSTGFGYDRLFRRDDNHAQYARVNLVTQGVRRLGAAGLDLAWVACGRLDFYWEAFLNPWDIAPGLLLVEEAGGRTTDFRGRRVDVSDRSLLTSNGRVHAQVLRALRSTPRDPMTYRRGLERLLPTDLAARVRQSSRSRARG